MIDVHSPLGREYFSEKRKSEFFKFAALDSVEEIFSWLTVLGFRDFKSCQTLLKPIEGIKTVDDVLEGYGKGIFVVLSATKG